MMNENSGRRPGVGNTRVGVSDGKIASGNPMCRSLRYEGGDRPWIDDFLENHLQKIDGRNLWVSQTPITQRLWCAISANNPSKFVGEDRPVENVSWRNCIEWIADLNKLDEVGNLHFRFRLPTVQEWNFLANDITVDYINEEEFRAGPSLEEGSDDCLKEFDMRSILDCVGWCWENSGGETHPVANKMVNRYGLYDLIGNVYEWCGDATEDGVCRYCLGGCWCSISKELREGDRYFAELLPETTKNAMTGFRVVAEKI